MCTGCLQPRQSLLNAAARVGEVSQDFIVCIESESDLDRDFKVMYQSVSISAVFDVYFMLHYFLFFLIHQCMFC